MSRNCIMVGCFGWVKFIQRFFGFHDMSLFEISPFKVIVFFLAFISANANALISPDDKKDMTKMVIIDTTLVDCSAPFRSKCMRVRSPEQESWSLFYDKIEGFTFIPGAKYVLKIRVTRVEHPPADGSSLHYTMLEKWEYGKYEEGSKVQPDAAGTPGSEHKK